MQSRLKSTIHGVAILCLLMAINSNAADVVNEAEPTASVSVEQQDIEPAPEPVAATESEIGIETEVITEDEVGTAPAEILGGNGLKDRKLSEVFEQFVPSESISADNAVPFPVDI